MSEHSVAEAEKNLSDLVDRSLSGETVILTRKGTPLVELRPLASAKPRRVIRAADVDRLYASLPKLSYKGTVDCTALIREMRDEGF